MVVFFIHPLNRGGYEYEYSAISDCMVSLSLKTSLSHYYCCDVYMTLFSFFPLPFFFFFFFLGIDILCIFYLVWMHILDSGSFPKNHGFELSTLFLCVDVSLGSVREAKSTSKP